MDPDSEHGMQDNVGLVEFGILWVLMIELRFSIGETNASNIKKKS